MSIAILLRVYTKRCSLIGNRPGERAISESSNTKATHLGSTGSVFPGFDDQVSDEEGCQLQRGTPCKIVYTRSALIYMILQTQAEDDFEDESPAEYQPKRQGRSSTGSSFQADSVRGAKRDYDEVDSADVSEAAFDESRNNSRASKRTRRYDSGDQSLASGAEDAGNERPSADVDQAPEVPAEPENGVSGPFISESHNSD